MRGSRDVPIRLGVEADNMGAAAIDPGIVALARAIEDTGVHSISVSDHLVSFRPDDVWLESMMSLAAISSVTSRARLVSSVVVLPQRNTLEFLRLVHTLDALSGGRFVLGVGVGGGGREIEALGYDSGTRGRRMDEMLEVIRGVDAGAVPPFAGEHVRIPEGVFVAPHPEPGRSIPLYVAGINASAVSVRRALRFADGWMSYGFAGETEFDALAAALARLRAEREERGLPRLDTIYKLDMTAVDDPRVIPDVLRLAEIGFDEVIVQHVWGSGLDAGLELIGRLQEAIR